MAHNIAIPSTTNPIAAEQSPSTDRILWMDIPTPIPTQTKRCMLMIASITIMQTRQRIRLLRPQAKKRRSNEARTRCGRAVLSAIALFANY